MKSFLYAGWRIPTAITLQRLALLLCTVLLGLRAWPRVVYAHLWAEDGAIFLPAALESGWRSLLEPYAGYYQLVPRLLSAALVSLPLSYFAYLVAVICGIAYAAVVSRVAGPNYRWLVGSDTLRIAAALTLCLVPGLEEVLGNMANLHTVLFIYVYFLAWKDVSVPLSFSELALIVLAAGSEAATVVFAPAFLVRFSFAKSSQGGWRELAAVAIIAIWSIAHRGASLAAAATGMIKIAIPSFASLARAWFRFICDHYFLQPTLGDTSVNSLHHHEAWQAFALAAILFAFITWGLRSRSTWQTRALIVAPAVCAGTMCIMVWIARPGTLQWFDMYTQSFARSLHNLPTAPFALIMWLGAFVRLELARVPWGYVFLAAYAGFACHHFNLGPQLGSERDWPRTARLLENAWQTSSAIVHLPCNPENWFITYSPTMHLPY